MKRLLILLPLLLLGCEQLKPGEACEATGDGFTRKDPCLTTCIEWSVACADGSSVTPGVCSGNACTSDADCATGYACAPTGSVEASCLPDDLCASGYGALPAPSNPPEPK